MLHGVNEVAKSAPYYSAARGFGADDAAFLASEGFNALRLGVDMRGLMPLPGQLDDACGARAIATPSKPRRTAGARTRNWDPATLR